MGKGEVEEFPEMDMGDIALEQQSGLYCLDVYQPSPLLLAGSNLLGRRREMTPNDQKELAKRNEIERDMRANIRKTQWDGEDAFYAFQDKKISKSKLVALIANDLYEDGYRKTDRLNHTSVWWENTGK
jgi:hypothetical protein